MYLFLVVLKDYGMVPYIKIFLDDECYRSATLSILEQLSVINYEEYMSIIIGALCSSTQWELHLKLDLLKVINVALTWALFSWELSFFQDGKSRRKKSHRTVLDSGKLGHFDFEATERKNFMNVWRKKLELVIASIDPRVSDP